MENQDKKRLLIIDAALKRFAHYGLAKTTMTEIAKDISFSKALLYYYFPDKLTLYVSTVEYLMQMMSREMVKSIDKTNTSTEGIFKLLQKRQNYIQKYYKLFESSQMIGQDLPGGLSDKFEKAHAFETLVISSLFSRGITHGELTMNNPKLIAEVFSNALSGIHLDVMMKHNYIFPDKEHFKQIFMKEKVFAEVFMAGLQKKT